MNASSLFTALARTPYGAVVPYLMAAITLCSILDAALPQPAPGSRWLILRKLVSVVAVNFGNAANRNQPPLSALNSPSSPVPPAVLRLFPILFVVGLLSACALTPTEKADVAEGKQIAAAAGQLYCAVGNPIIGPVVVAALDANGVPIIATGAGKALVDAACAKLNGMAVSPPIDVAAVPRMSAPGIAADKVTGNPTPAAS